MEDRLGSTSLDGIVRVSHGSHLHERNARGKGVLSGQNGRLSCCDNMLRDNAPTDDDDSVGGGIPVWKRNPCWIYINCLMFLSSVENVALPMQKYFYRLDSVQAHCRGQLRRGDDNEHFCRFHRRRDCTSVYLGQREASVRRGEMERSVPAIKVMAHEREERDRERGTERNYNGPMTRHFSSLESRTSPHASTLEGLAATSSDPLAKCANL